MNDRPPYRVPSMAEVRALPPSGITVASLFAGGGGSSTGYRMTGARVRYASEFVPAAAETYRANADPSTVIDTRDVREVPASAILDACDGPPDVLDGSPPCASFSTAGKRHRGWGEEHDYSGRVQRTDDLFPEYVRLVREVRPRAIVAENVTGLTVGVSHGYLRGVLRDLRAAGYRVRAAVLDASWLDVPQARRRLIIVGYREDLGIDPAHPTPLPYQRPATDAVPTALGVCRGGFEAYASGTSGGRYLVNAESYPLGTLGAMLSTGSGRGPSSLVAVSDDVEVDPETGYRVVDRRFGIEEHYRRHRFRLMTLAELRLACGFPADYVLTGSYAQRWERCGRSVPPLMMRAIARVVTRALGGEPS